MRGRGDLDTPERACTANHVPKQIFIPKTSPPAPQTAHLSPMTEITERLSAALADRYKIPGIRAKVAWRRKISTVGSRRYTRC